MPVSTRSHGIDQPSPLKNPHHGLKEKMKALTLFYEQQKQSSRVLKNPISEIKPCDSVMKEKNTMLNSTITRNLVIPPHNDDLQKENVIGVDRIVGFPCQKKTGATTTVVRKLSMGGRDPQIGGEIRVISENSSVGSRILVFVRLRPMAKKEKEAGSRCCVRIVNQRDVYLTEFASETDYLRLKRVRGRHFCFDASFTDSTTQQEVYSTTTAELVEGVLQGKNGSVFCYGATGAGKTYTMLGTVENPGVMVLAIKDLFAKIRQRSCDGNHVVHLSYLEVYNETVRDLLSPGRPLVLREDKQGIVAAGLTQYRAYSTDEVMALLQRGNQNRTTEPTRANETSSRSHAILQVVAEYRARDISQNIVSRIGKLSLIDLAGSERALATDQRTMRSIEGANINRSLLALSSCINALVEGKKHIPFRNSKLTQLLKDSLGGACNTVMIANISPSNLSFGETQNTLHWADRAKEIRTKACEAHEELLQVPTNDADQAKLLLEVQKENRDLRMQLARQQKKLLTVQAQSLAVNSTATPLSTTSMLTPPTTKPSEKRRTRSSFLTGNCFTTPDSKRRPAAGGDTVQVLQQTVKVLEEEMKRMKEDHALQIKQKDSFINDLTRKLANSSTVGCGEGVKRIVTRSSLRPKAPTRACELKSPKQRFESPAPTAKKRTFWDITTANSPSMTTLSGRKTRSHIAKPAQAPSMLLQLAYPSFWFVFMFGPHIFNYVFQPGFAREKLEPFR
ncbi:Kinesin-like protein KIN-8A [Ranunculus cassubicifolius]